MSTEITRYVAPQIPILDAPGLDLIKSIAAAVCMSQLAGPFKGNREDATLAMISGHALGLHPGIVLSKAYAVNGRIGWPADVYLGVAISHEPRLRYEITEETHEACTMRGWLEDGSPPYEIRFTIDDARRAGLDQKPNWKNWTRDMLLSKAALRMLRRVAPHAMLALPASTHDGEIETEDPAPVTESRAEVVEETGGGSAPDLVAARAVAETRARIDAEAGVDENPDADLDAIASDPKTLFLERAKACGWRTKPDLLWVVNAMLKVAERAEVKGAAQMSAEDWAVAWAELDKRYDAKGARRVEHEVQQREVVTVGDSEGGGTREEEAPPPAASPKADRILNPFEDAFTRGDRTTFVALCRFKEKETKGLRLLEVGAYRGGNAPPPLYFVSAPILTALGLTNSAGPVSQKLMGGSDKTPPVGAATIMALAKEVAK